MKLQIKKRLYKIKERLYIEAKYLSDYGFKIGTAIKYEFDKKNNRIIIIPTKQSKKHVAQTTQKTGSVVPVIDIKGDEVKDFFAKHNKVELEIQDGKIIFTVLEDVKSQAITNVVSFEEAKFKKENLEKRQYSVSVSEFAKVVNYQQLSIFDLFEADSTEIKDSFKGKIGKNLKEKAIKTLSLFSGCGSMDKGFLDAGYEFIFANDRYEKKALKDYHIQTYRHNIGDHIVMKDVLEFRKEDIPETDFVTAGVPCVKYSKLNTVNNIRNDIKEDEELTHPIVEQTINIIQWSKAKAFLIENVGDFVQVKGGAMLKRLKERLSNFNIITKFIDATHLGSAQKRIRVFILGIIGSQPEIEIPHLAEIRTVKDAFKDVENAPQQDIFFQPTPLILKRMSYVPQGGNINYVPMELRAPNKKFSNYCQRLDESKHAPTVTHIQDDVFFHPRKERYLTARETARLFSLPDDFTFVGSRTAIFEMLKNAVDYKVSSFLAKIIKKQLLPILD